MLSREVHSIMPLSNPVGDLDMNPHALDSTIALSSVGRSVSRPCPCINLALSSSSCCSSSSVARLASFPVLHKIAHLPRSTIELESSARSLGRPRGHTSQGACFWCFRLLACLARIRMSLRSLRSTAELLRVGMCRRRRHLRTSPGPASVLRVALESSVTCSSSRMGVWRLTLLLTGKALIDAAQKAKALIAVKVYISNYGSTVEKGA